MPEETDTIEPTEFPDVPPSRIAVLRLGTLGDALLTTPLYAALKRIYPESHLSVIASSWNRVVAENHPDVDEVISIPSGIAGVPQLLRIPVGRRFDLYIDPKDHRSTTSRIMAEFIRAKQKLVSVGNMPFFSGADIVPPPSGPHFVDSALAPMMILAPDEEFDRRPSIRIPDEAMKKIEKEIGSQEKNYMVVNISTGSPTRRWPEEKWRRLVGQMAWDGELIIIASPGEEEEGKRVASGRPGARYLPTASLMEAAALVKKAHGLITSDTSIVHIASALNTPLLALYFRAPRMMKKFAPLSDIRHVLVAPDEQPVAVIEVEEVAAAAERLADISR